MPSAIRSLFNSLIETVYKNKHAIFALAIFAVAANLFTIYFIKQEHFIYSWDYVGYWSKFINFTHDFLESPLSAFKTLISSIRDDDYNYLPVFPLVPWGILFGTTRLDYILSIVNIFALSAVISFVVLHKKFSQINGFTAVVLPFISTGVMVLSPNFWDPILYGFPDIGGILLINLILLLYMNRPFSEQSSGNLLVIALLIPTLILFRRWYAYWGVAFYISLFIVECGVPLANRRLKVKHFIKILSKILLQGFTSAIFLLIVAPNFTGRIIRTDYADIYSAYRGSATIFQSFIKVVKEIGLVYFIMFILGAACAFLDKRTRKITVFLLAQWAIIFVLFARTQDFDPHQLYLLLPAVFLFSALSATRFFVKTKNYGIIAACGLAFIFILNFIPSFSRETPWHTKTLIPVFADAGHPPLARNDIKEIDRILSVLEELLAEPEHRAYVLASSQVLNSSILISAHYSLNRHRDISKRILRTNDVDKRDGFPREFLTAKYVVVADPIQFHLNPQDQRVIGIPAGLVLRGEGIGAAFNKLPYEFNLDKNVKVYIYKKIRPFTDPDLEALSGLLKGYYPDRPNIYEIKNGAEEVSVDGS